MTPSKRKYRVPTSPVNHERHATSDARAPGAESSALRELLDADQTAIAIVGLDGTVRSANESALRLVGADSLEALQAGSPGLGVLRSLLDHAPRHVITGASDATWQGEIDHIGDFGEPVVLRATVTARRDDALEGGGFIGLMAHDVTRARNEAAQLRHRATHDPLTGLANRRQILATLAAAIGSQRTRAGHVAAIFIDVDQLKYVNDALGHQIGDRLLVATAQRLAESVRPEDRVARIGGDEFLVVCSDLPDDATAMDLADRLRQSLTGHLRLREVDVRLSVSIGVALSDPEILAMGDSAAASTLINNADTAMYRAKTSGRGRCVQYTAEMRSETRERTELGAELARAISERRLTIDFQPVYSTTTRQAVGAEALVRWHHCRRGQVDPAEFVMIAETSGSAGPLGEFVLGQALVEMRRWVDAGVVGDDFAVHVNVSAVQLASSSFVTTVESLLRTNGVEPHRLVLETREAALLGQNHDTDRSIRALRRLGVQIAIDNFGTGTTALSVLIDVGADILKLDGALALPAGSSDSDTRLVRAVMLLAHALDMKVVAERVSSSEQLDQLLAAGCDLVQGNLLAAPAPPENLITSARF